MNQTDKSEPGGNRMDYNYECKKCGKCCSNYLPLLKSEKEKMKKLAKGRNPNRLLVLSEWYNTCPFLNESRQCEIYDDRPIICREYTCYKQMNNIFNTDIFSKFKMTDFSLVDIRKEIFK